MSATTKRLQQLKEAAASALSDTVLCDVVLECKAGGTYEVLGSEIKERKTNIARESRFTTEEARRGRPDLLLLFSVKTSVWECHHRVPRHL